MTMKTVFRLSSLMAAVFVASSAVAANCPAGFPQKPLRFAIGFGAGGGTDTIGRAIASGLERNQKWTTVVENRPGGGGGLVSQWLKLQPADGYTIAVVSTDAVTVGPAVGQTGFTWEDYDYLGSGMQTWMGLVALADRPYNDLAGFIAYAREKGRATLSVAGPNQEILVRQLAAEYKVNIIAVPGTGAAEAMTSMLGGHVDATMQGTLHVSQIKAGKVKQLASLIERRVPYAPNSGTLSEQGSKATPLETHTIFMTPKGLPDPIKTCLKEAIDNVIRSPEYKAQMDKFENEALNLGEQKTRDLVRHLAQFYKSMLAK